MKAGPLLLFTFLILGKCIPVSAQDIFTVPDSILEVGLDKRVQISIATCCLHCPSDSPNWFSDRSILLLDSTASFLKEHPNISLEIGDHTDSRGSDSMNLVLSQNRADFMRDYLLRQGIDSSRVSAVGFGERYPLITEEEIYAKERDRRQMHLLHSYNRRTILKIVAIRED